jgi:hypothetical protein
VGHVLSFRAFSSPATVERVCIGIPNAMDGRTNMHTTSTVGRQIQQLLCFAHSPPHKERGKEAFPILKRAHAPREEWRKKHLDLRRVVQDFPTLPKKSFKRGQRKCPPPLPPPSMVAWETIEFVQFGVAIETAEPASVIGRRCRHHFCMFYIVTISVYAIDYVVSIPWH